MIFDIWYDIVRPFAFYTGGIVVGIIITYLSMRASAKKNGLSKEFDAIRKSWK